MPKRDPELASGVGGKFPGYVADGIQRRREAYFPGRLPREPSLWLGTERIAKICDGCLADGE